jgi:hypothetical protein
MRKILLMMLSFAFVFTSVFSQKRDTKVFTIFSSPGCSCVGSGGPPLTYTDDDEVLSELRKACPGIDFIKFSGHITDAYYEVMNNKVKYDGILNIGTIGTDYRLAFTGLPTVMVHNLGTSQSYFPWHVFKTGEVKADGTNILIGGENYKEVKILTAGLDRRNICDPSITKAYFNDMVYKVKLIQVVKELKETRILSIKRKNDEIIGEVNYKFGDHNQAYPPNHNELYMNNFKNLFGIEIVMIEPEEFYEAYAQTDIKRAEEVADEWINRASSVEVSRSEIVKTARGYLAHDALREKYNCNAISTHVRSTNGSDNIEDRYNPSLGMELGFKPKGIMAVCQNYPDIVLTQVLAYLLVGRPSMLGDIHYDILNSVEMILHCGMPVNPYGDDNWLPYRIRPHAESPVRDQPDAPGASTGLTTQWPEGEPVTFWEIHSLLGQIRLHTGEVVDKHKIYTGGEDIDNVWCTTKIVARLDDVKKVRDQHFASLYGVHHTATLGDLRQQIKDVAVFLGIDVIERDR